MDVGSDTPNIGGGLVHTQDNFKPVFKLYKSRRSAVDLSKVVDFGQGDVCFRFEVTKREVSTDVGDHICCSLGLKPPQEWQSFSLKSSPGFIFIRNPFKNGKQRYWLKRLLQEIPTPSNKSNLPDGFPVKGDSVWDLHCQGSGRKSSFSQLRWVTLGYHYNWNTKLYDPEDASPFPEDIGILSSCVAACLGFQNFRAEAAIVNYYNMNSTLGGHNDHSELDHDAPLISFSFGQSAIFLVGGSTKAVAPTPILLRSGDIVILSSASRLAFHGVPRIMHDKPENLKLCWGVSDNVGGRKTEKPQTAMEDKDEVDCTITGKSNPRSMCKSEKKENLSLIGSHTESENCTLCAKEQNVQFAPVSESHSGKDKLQRKQKEISRKDEEDQRGIKVRRVTGSAAISSARIDHKGQHQFAKEEQTIGYYCSDRRKVEADFTIKEETDGVSSLKLNYPNFDEILSKIRMETEMLFQNERWEPFEKYLQNARLNVSVRQVNMSPEITQ